MEISESEDDECEALQDDDNEAEMTIPIPEECKVVATPVVKPLSERARNLKAFFKAHEAIPAENSTIIRGREGLEVLPLTKPEDEITNMMEGLSVEPAASDVKQASFVDSNMLS